MTYGNNTIPIEVDGDAVYVELEPEPEPYDTDDEKGVQWRLKYPPTPHSKVRLPPDEEETGCAAALHTVGGEQKPSASSTVSVIRKPVGTDRPLKSCLKKKSALIEIGQNRLCGHRARSKSADSYSSKPKPKAKPLAKPLHPLSRPKLPTVAPTAPTASNSSDDQKRSQRRSAETELQLPLPCIWPIGIAVDPVDQKRQQAEFNDLTTPRPKRRRANSVHLILCTTLQSADDAHDADAGDARDADAGDW